MRPEKHCSKLSTGRRAVAPRAALLRKRRLSPALELGDQGVRGPRRNAATEEILGADILTAELNPTHPDFSSVVIGEPESFAFDERLLAGPDDTPDNK
jgi:hypothetical protein